MVAISQGTEGVSSVEKVTSSAQKKWNEQKLIYLFGRDNYEKKSLIVKSWKIVCKQIIYLDNIKLSII